MVSGISITSEGGLRLIEEGSTLQFSASIQPANATNQAVSWNVNPGTGSARITQSGLLTAEGEGDVLVTASAMDGSGVSSNFALNISGPSGLYDQKINRPIVYPNPSQGKIYLDVGSLPLEKVRIFSVLGSKILDLEPDLGGAITEVDMSDQVEGAYFLHIYTKEQSYVYRIIINK